MKRVAYPAFILAILLMAIVPASAAIIVLTGPCPGGGSWEYILTTDGNNNVLSMHGMMCGGESFAMNPGPKHLSGTNDWGTQCDAFVDNGDGTWIRATVDPTGRPLQIWGVGSDGVYWMIDTWTDDGGGGVN